MIKFNIDAQIRVPAPSSVEFPMVTPDGNETFTVPVAVLDDVTLNEIADNFRTDLFEKAGRTVPVAQLSD